MEGGRRAHSWGAPSFFVAVCPCLSQTPSSKHTKKPKKGMMVTLENLSSDELAWSNYVSGVLVALHA